MQRYTGAQTDEDASLALVRAAFVSPASIAVVALQDLLGQDSGARMNVPGLAGGNWRYRAPARALTTTFAGELAALTRAFDRVPAPPHARKRPAKRLR
jgi:4-alpha-glucanotransferase